MRFISVVGQIGNPPDSQNTIPAYSKINLLEHTRMTEPRRKGTGALSYYPPNAFSRASHLAYSFS